MASSEKSENRLLAGLHEQRIVFLDKITPDSAMRSSEQLLQLQLNDATKPIHVLINSPGGSTQGAFMMHDLIANLLTAPVIATVMGYCASAATFVLLACKSRRSLPHAQFLLHSGTFSGIALKADEVTPKQTKRLNDEAQKSARRMIDFYAKKLSLSEKRVRDLIAKGDEDFDAFLSAQEALSLKLITEIVKDNAGLFPVSTRKTEEKD